MKVLFFSAEASPLVKVGGLADVAGSLPKALVRRGIDVRIVMPLHRGVDLQTYSPQRLASQVAVGVRSAEVWQIVVNGVPIYLVDSPQYFDRPQVYGEPDDPERFLFFCDAALAAAPHLKWQPDILHLNEWHTGFLATRLAFNRDHPWAGLPRLFTIHNLAFHGNFDPAFSERHGLPEAALTSPVPSVDVASGMAQGMLWADVISTVSPTYAVEIQTPEFGAGLDPLLRHRRDRLFGILNGIDYDEYNPSLDRYITVNYGSHSLHRRIANKEVLQQKFGLPNDAETPLFGLVGRLYHQKGIDLAYKALFPLLMERTIQFVALGTGDIEYHRMLHSLQETFPDKVSVALAFDVALAQQIYAGCDIFLMPSRFEPCGLGQMIALRYGAVPVVRRTGGLADTIEDCDENLSTGNGFVFNEASPVAMRQAILRALDAFVNQKDAWRALQARGMETDFSWRRSAGEYEELYERARELALARS